MKDWKRIKQPLNKENTIKAIYSLLLAKILWILRKWDKKVTVMKMTKSLKNQKMRSMSPKIQMRMENNLSLIFSEEELICTEQVVHRTVQC